MQLVKVNKKEQAISQSADPDKKEKPVRIVKDVMQDSCNIKNVDKKEMIFYLMQKLDSIQSKADVIKRNLSETDPASANKRKKNRNDAQDWKAF